MDLYLLRRPASDPVLDEMVRLQEAAVRRFMPFVEGVVHVSRPQYLPSGTPSGQGVLLLGEGVFPCMDIRLEDLFCGGRARIAFREHVLPAGDHLSRMRRCDSSVRASLGLSDRGPFLEPLVGLLPLPSGVLQPDALPAALLQDEAVAEDPLWWMRILALRCRHMRSCEDTVVLGRRTLPAGSLRTVVSFLQCPPCPVLVLERLEAVPSMQPYAQAELLSALGSLRG